MFNQVNDLILLICQPHCQLSSLDICKMLYPTTTITHTHTRLTALFPALPEWAGTRKVKPVWFYWSKRQWVAVASAGPYASLHLAPGR